MKSFWLTANYFDRDLIIFCRYGWPISHFGEFGNTNLVEYWKGASNFPHEIENYLHKEIECKVVLGPFKENPFNRPCYFSPLNTRDKKDSLEKRIILDLSFPEGNSVNDGIDKTKYLGEDIILKFPTVDKLAQIMVSLGKGCLLFKRDLKRYYRQIFVDPVDAVKLGYRFQDNIYFDAALPMGMTSSIIYNGKRLFPLNLFF